jgi:hypothetical protein
MIDVKEQSEMVPLTRAAHTAAIPILWVIGFALCLFVGVWMAKHTERGVCNEGTSTQRYYYGCDLW